MAPRNKSSLNVDLAARAEAKLNVHAKVPEKSTGRLLDALTDIIRPFSEARGLRGDHIRLQRESVAIEIAKRARARLAVERAKIEPISGKILVPLIEAASNEEPDDSYMMDMWASLLASAATSSKVEPRFIGILKELHGKQAKLFEKIARNNFSELEYPLANLEDAPLTLEGTSIQQHLRDFFRLQKTCPDPGCIYATAVGWIDQPGAYLIDIIIHFRDETWSGLADDERDKDTEFDLEILSSLGLCRRVNEYVNSRFGYEVQVVYYHLTELGVRFFFCLQLHCRQDDKFVAKQTP